MKVRGNALVAHGGGPTTVLNASLAGIVDECRGAGVGKLFGALGGAGGILKENFADLLGQPAGFWEQAALSPGSVLGSSRAKVSEPDFEMMLDVLRRHDIRYLFLNGGNGTMELALRLSETARRSSHEAFVIGVPKTIDNDLAITDHSPGYASAARFFAYALRDIGADNRALPGITVVEILGRNAGWLAAATIQARHHWDDAPHLIYMPERRLAFDDLAADVEKCHARFGRAVIAVCEGQLDERGDHLERIRESPAARPWRSISRTSFRSGWRKRSGSAPAARSRDCWGAPARRWYRRSIARRRSPADGPLYGPHSAVSPAR